MRKIQRRELLRIARRRQRDVLCDVMLSARQCENVADAGRTFKIDALPAGEHFGAAAAFAEAGVRRLRRRETAACGGTDFARRRFRNGMGIPAEARHPQEARRRAIAGRRTETRVAAGGLLNRACGAAEERWVSNRSWRLMCAGQAVLTAADIDSRRCKNERQTGISV